MDKIKNDILLRKLAGEATDRPPIWLMRQAGRILPQYRKIRSSLSGFVELVTTPHLASEVTIQPVDHLDVDAAIIFSDILVIPEAMGLPYELIEKKGPYFPKTITSKADIDKLISGQSAAENLDYVYKAIELTKKNLENRVPLIGFSGAPWTLMSYMIEGQGSKTFSKAKAFLYKEPVLSGILIEKLTDSIIAYLKLKIAAGVDVVQVFDSWAGSLNRDIYKRFFMPSMKRIVEEITEVPVIVFAKGAHFALEDQKDLNADCIGIDWTVEMSYARQIFGKDQVLQGNIDPCLLYSSIKEIEEKAHKTIQEAGNQHVFNLGHGVYPDTPLENIEFLVKNIKSYRY